MTRRGPIGALALLLFLPPGVAGAQPLPSGRAQPAAAVPAQPVAAVPAQAAPIAILMEAGAGRLLRLPAPATGVLAADPRIARVQPASPTSLFLMAVGPGRTTVVATAEDGAPVAEYDITVRPSRAAGQAAGAPAGSALGSAQGSPLAPPGLAPTGLAPTGLAALPPPNAAAVQAMIHHLVPGAEAVRVSAAGPGALALDGAVPTAADARRAEAIARGYGGEGREVINSLTLLSAIQVNLRVRVAEISRQVSRDLGFNWQALANGGSGLLLGFATGGAGGVLSALTASATASSPTIGRFGLGYRSGRFDINTVVDALASDQLITILAEPNLTAQSGESASFLAGGEFPVPVAASSVTNSITIEYKQFGVSLAFVPTVLGPDRLNLRVRPEVSELSENGAISLPLASGVVRIPALSVRRAETTVELGSGQSFAIAGLLQRGTTLNNGGLSGLGDVPVLGALFRSDRFRRNETELVIIITPYLVRPVSDPQVLAAPTDGFRPATDLDRVLDRRQIARGAPALPRAAAVDAGFILD